MQSQGKRQGMMARAAAAVLAALTMSAICWLPAAAETYTTTQMAPYFDDLYAGGSLSYAVYPGTDGSHRQIYTYKNGVITQISNSAYDNISSTFAGNYISWSGYDGQDWEIFFYNGSSVIQLTNNNYDDGHSSYTCLGETYYLGPQMNGNNLIVWSGNVGTDMEIYTYNISTGVTTQLTNNNYRDDFVAINNNGYIAWKSKIDTTYYMNLYNGSTTSQIASGAYNYANTRLNNNNQVAWVSSDGNDNEVFLYNGGTITQITNNNYDDYWLRLSDDGRMAWQGYDGSHYQIFSYKISTGVTTQVTNSAYDNYFPMIATAWNNPKIVWFGWDGTDYEIYAYDGSSTQQITNNNYDDKFAKVNYAGQILWNGYDGTNWYLYGAQGDYSRYDFVYHYASGDTYTGYVYAPTSFKSFISNGTDIYNEPAPMGGFSLDGGYYHFTKVTDGFDAFWDKKSYINSYYETDYSQSLSVNGNGSANAGSVYVADRTLAHESGYALYNSQPSYFDPFTTAKTYSSSGFSAYYFYYYYSAGSDCYTGYFYAPTDWASSMTSQYQYNQPIQMGGAALAGYYYFYNQVDGYDVSYNKKAYVTAYYDAAVGATLSVSPTASTSSGTVTVNDRLRAYETGYVIYGSSYKYFDPYNSVDFP